MAGHEVYKIRCRSSLQHRNFRRNNPIISSLKWTWSMTKGRHLRLWGYRRNSCSDRESRSTGTWRSHGTGTRSRQHSDYDTLILLRSWGQFTSIYSTPIKPFGSRGDVQQRPCIPWSIQKKVSWLVAFTDRGPRDTRQKGICRVSTRHTATTPVPHTLLSVSRGGSGGSCLVICRAWYVVAECQVRHSGLCSSVTECHRRKTRHTSLVAKCYRVYFLGARRLWVVSKCPR